MADFADVRRRLAEVDADELRGLTDAWRTRAPKRLVTAFDAGSG
jgi:hypothetical protein